MSELVIYHNPRCTKSRQTLTLLRERGLEPTIIEYLQTPPDEKTLSGIIDQLGIEAAELIRKKEFKALGLEATDVADELIVLMVTYPEIIERPIVVANGRAAIGRPPENVLEILP